MLILLVVSFFAVVSQEILTVPQDPLDQFSHKSNEFVKKSLVLNQRLSQDLIPTQYNLAIIPIIDPNDPDYLKAPGRVVITAKSYEASMSITLNTIDIAISQTRVTHTGHGRVPILKLVENVTEETVTIQLGRRLIIGEEYSIDIIFESRVANDSQVGLYLNKFEDSTTGETNYQVVTHFEGTDARRAFPCFDKPFFKAKFLVRIGRQASHVSLFNTERDGPPIKINDRPGYWYDLYFETLPMSTYLVGIIVMKNFTNVTADKMIYPSARVSVWIPGPTSTLKQNDTLLSANTAASMLRFFHDYTNQSYQYTKLDSVTLQQAIPLAIGNWGLNIYQSQNLIYSKFEMTTTQLWQIVCIIAQKVSQQWFGNVVTINWWTDLWLTDGLTTYLQFLGVEEVNSEFTPWQHFTIDVTQKGMIFDGRPDAVPVRGDNETHYEKLPFESTSQKGAALMRMLEGFLTPGTLRRGLQRYLNENIYGNVDQDALFSALMQQSATEKIVLPDGLDVKSILDTWTRQAGFPLVRVSRVSRNRIYISQERFSNEPNKILDPHMWHVPIAYTTKSDVPIKKFQQVSQYFLPKTWIKNTEIAISHLVERTDEWILVNPDVYYFYRVLYDDYLTQLLIHQLIQDHSQIHALSRGQLIDDYFKCAYGEYISIVRAFQLTEFLEKEFDLPVWATVFNNIQKVNDLFSDNDEVGLEFREYFLKKLTPAFDSVGSVPHDKDSPVTKMLRGHLLQWACALGHTQCYLTAQAQVGAWMSTGTNLISTDLQPMLYCAATFNGGKVYSDFFLEVYQNPMTSPRQRNLVLAATSCPKDPWLLIDILNLAIDINSPITAEDGAEVMGLVARNVYGRTLVLNFIQENVDQILNSKVGENGITSVISNIAKFLSTIDQKTQIQEFLESNRKNFSQNLIGTIEENVREIDTNIRWMQVHNLGICEFFAKIHKTNHL